MAIAPMANQPQMQLVSVSLSQEHTNLEAIMGANDEFRYPAKEVGIFWRKQSIITCQRAARRKVAKFYEQFHPIN